MCPCNCLLGPCGNVLLRIACMPFAPRIHLHLRAYLLQLTSISGLCSSTYKHFVGALVDKVPSGARQNAVA